MVRGGAGLGPAGANPVPGEVSGTRGMKTGAAGATRPSKAIASALSPSGTRPSGLRPSARSSSALSPSDLSASGLSPTGVASEVRGASGMKPTWPERSPEASGLPAPGLVRPARCLAECAPRLAMPAIEGHCATSGVAWHVQPPAGRPGAPVPAACHRPADRAPGQAQAWPFRLRNKGTAGPA